MHRRTLLQAMAAGTVATMVPVAEAQEEPEDSCDIHARALADALMKKHGSIWKIRVDCLNEFVLVYREAAPVG